MKSNELQNWLTFWGLQASDGAAVLCIQKSKMSEYLSGKRALPPYIAAHIETFNALDKEEGIKIIQKRTNNI